jgi:3-hydroxyisobutyrate dehydrogenase
MSPQKGYLAGAAHQNRSLSVAPSNFFICGFPLGHRQARAAVALGLRFHEDKRIRAPDPFQDAKVRTEWIICFCRETEMARIGFVGLGNMGMPMAANLIKAGHAVTGYDVVPPAVAKLSVMGGTAADGVAAACTDADAIITMLPAGEHVREVYCGAGGVGGVIAAASPGALLIDSSTIDVTTAREVAVLATGHGLAMVDAPVSGGVAGAEAGTLTFMVGGAEAAVARARPLLEAMGKTIVHAGGPGNGQAAKICNNMILGVSMIAVSEAFLLAEKLGLEAQRLFDIAAQSSGQCWALTSYCPVPGPVPSSPANRGYQAGFTAAMMLKDLKLAQDAAARCGAVTPLGAGAAELYALCAGHGHAAKDFSAIIEFLRGS